MVLFVEAGFETGDAEVVEVKGDAHGGVFREARTTKKAFSPRLDSTAFHAEGQSSKGASR